MMLMGMMPVTAMADTSHTHSVGQDNSQNETWIAISSLDGITQDGSYYLTQPVTLNTTWICDYNVKLCLNGNSITCDASDSDTIVINNDKTFILTDCQENAGSVTYSESKTGRGICNNGTFYMYGGNISGNAVTGSKYSSEYGKEYKGGGVYNSGTFTCIRAQSPVTQLRLTLMQMKETMTMVTIMAMAMIDIIVSSMEAVSTMMEVLLCLAVAF